MGRRNKGPGRDGAREERSGSALRGLGDMMISYGESEARIWGAGSKIERRTNLEILSKAMRGIHQLRSEGGRRTWFEERDGKGPPK